MKTDNAQSAAPVQRLVGQLISSGRLDPDRDHLGTYMVMADGHLPYDGMSVTFDKEIMRKDGLEHAWRPGKWTVTLRPICKMLVPIYGKWGECQGGFKYMRHMPPNVKDQPAGASVPSQAQTNPDARSAASPCWADFSSQEKKP